MKPKKDAPMPLVSQEFLPVPDGRKAVTTVCVGPHTVAITAYPNRGYYIEVNGNGRARIH